MDPMTMLKLVSMVKSMQGGQQAPQATPPPPPWMVQGRQGMEDQDPELIKRKKLLQQMQGGGMDLAGGMDTEFNQYYDMNEQAPWRF